MRPNSELMKTTTLEIHPIEEKTQRAVKQQSRKGVPKGKKSSVLIKNYRADYTWNRGGRLKELRIRRHYELQIMRRVYQEWHEMWWELRKEWRLMVRAECHHRYVVWSKVFGAWRLFVLYQKASAEKMELAAAIDNKAILTRAYRNWKEFVNLQREKKKITSKADRHHEQVLTRLVWMKWKDEHRIRQEQRDMEVVALQFWAYRIQAQHWLFWTEKLKEKRQVYHRHALSLRHYRLTIKRKCFFAWAQYWLQKRDRKRQQDMVSQEEKREKICLADSHHRRKLLMLVFSAFRLNLVQSRVKVMRNEMATEHYYKSLLRLHWNVWLRKCEDREEMQIIHLTEQARSHYQSVLKRKCWNGFVVYTSLREHRKMLVFSAFRLNLVQSRVKVMRNEMATEHYYKSLLRLHWNVWLRKCEDREEMQIIHLTEQARSHYQSVLKRKCWNGFVVYTSLREHRKTQQVQADAFFFVHSMPKFIFRWRIYVEMEKMKRENQEKCTQFRKENLMARFFYQWYNSYEEQRDFRMNWRMAVLHHEDCARRQFLAKWRERLHICEQEKEKQSEAEQHYHTVLRRKHLLAWAQYIRDLRKMYASHIYCEFSRYLLMKQSVWFNNIRLMATYLSVWKWRYQLKQEENGKTDIALWHWSLVLQKKILVAWFGYMTERKGKKERITHALERRRTRQIRQGVTQWIAVATDLSGMRAKIAAQQHAQDAFVKHQLVQRCALHWRYITTKRRTQKGDNPCRTVIDQDQFPAKDLDYVPKLKPQAVEKLRQGNTSKTVPSHPLVSTSPKRLSEKDAYFSSIRLPGRRKPRHPSFLEESLKKAGLFSESRCFANDSHRALQTEVSDERLVNQTPAMSFPDPVQSSHNSPVSITGQHQDPVDSHDMSQGIDTHIPHLDLYTVTKQLTNLQENSEELDFHLPPQQHVHFDHFQSIQRGFGEQIQLLTPDHFLLHPDHETPASQCDFSPLSTPRTVDSTSLAVRSMIQTIDSTSGITGAPQGINDIHSLPLSEQIIRIRNQLKSFEQQKKKLRKLQKQHKQLATWIVDEEGTVSELEIQEVKAEVEEMEKEISVLQKEIEHKKPECGRLVVEVNSLIKLMSEQNRG
uniref:SFI1-like protein n=1 Tax=Magallana gigas TaxID=29159 RepID=K1QQN7_MAGGI